MSEMHGQTGHLATAYLQNDYIIHLLELGLNYSDTSLKWQSGHHKRS